MDVVRARRGALSAALVSSALATATLHGAPTADATCFSIFGIGNGNGCTSNPTSFALAIGEGAIADASTGFFGGAFALGNNARATSAYTAFTLANAVGDNASASAMFSLFSLLGQLGTGSTAVIGGPNLALGISNGLGSQTTNIIGGFNVVAHVGPGSAAALGGTQLLLGYSGGSTPHTVGSTGLGNIAIQLGPGTTQTIGGLNLAIGASPWGSGAQNTLAGLLGTVALNIFGNGNATAQGAFGGAVNLFGTSSAQMAGIFATALNILGDGNTVRVLPGALLSVAFGLLSNDVTVEAGPGPLSLQGAIFQNGMAVGQAIAAAIESVSAPVDGATYVASQTLGDALSAALAGDMGSAFTTLASLPKSVLDAVLFGYDVDGVGPAGPVPGLLSAKDPDCTTQCHDGGPIYQLLVGLPKAVSTALANIRAAVEDSNTAEAADDQGADTVSASTLPDADSSATDEPVTAPEAEDATDEVAEDDETDRAAVDVVDEDDSTAPDAEESSDAPDSPSTTTDAEDGSDDSDDSDDDTGSSSDDDSRPERAGKHRADGPRHATK
ncbi:hypothetical protein PDG61_30500 [Mycolicibacterium sp. BiH015]|uniref:hypothetical protein n=1 Tax=Mycolicibacterium sp. BiH015 TaxID=3018808 RepID=UPI0022E8CAAF|nr:hypothetical protein [Mycolicibacterium sp. BiH015]MDA2895275.1 hypothetical protein [Mycolicibacterium sp. BiH015]